MNTLFDLDILMIPPVTFSRSRMLSLVLSLTTSILVFFLRLAAGDTYLVGVKTGTLCLEPWGQGRLEMFILGVVHTRLSEFWILLFFVSLLLAITEALKRMAELTLIISK